MSTTTADASADKEAQPRVQTTVIGTIFTLPSSKYDNVSAWTETCDITIFKDGDMWIQLTNAHRILAQINIRRDQFEAILESLGYGVPKVESRAVATQ